MCGPTNWIWRWGPILCIRDHAILFAARSFQTTKKKNVFFFCYLSLSRAQFRFRFRFILITLSMLFWTNEVFFTHLVFSALFRIPWRSLRTPVFPLATCSVQFLWANSFRFFSFFISICAICMPLLLQFTLCMLDRVQKIVLIFYFL